MFPPKSIRALSVPTSPTLFWLTHGVAAVVLTIHSALYQSLRLSARIA